MGDIEPFSIIPYKYHIGLYIFDKDITDPIDRDPIMRTNKFKNSRESKNINSIFTFVFIEENINSFLKFR